MDEQTERPKSSTRSMELTRRQFLSAASVTGAVVAANPLTGSVHPATAAQEPTATPIAQLPGETPAPEPAAPPVPGAREPATPFPPEQLPPVEASSEQQSSPPPAPLPPRQRVGYAVVGLGHLTIEEILPAFAQCENSRLVALVSGDAAKANRLGAEYGLNPQYLYNYQNFDSIRDNPEVEVVYIVLPNGLHEQFTLRSAQAGKHVLCEKPMANNSAQARNMIAACKKADRKLMIAYRIQYEPHNRMAREMVRQQQFGAVKFIEAVNGQNQGDPNQWRQKLALAGGGSLPDVGLYCLNTIRFILGEEPIEIMATTYSTPGDPRFKEVEENVLWQMRFPSGAQANCVTGYGHHRSNRYRIHMERGWANLDPAFEYRGLQMEVAYASGRAEIVEQRRIQDRNQFATEIDHMSDCVINGKQPFTPGEEGLQDHVLMEAIYKAARTRTSVKLAAVPKRDAFRGSEPKQD